MVLVHRRNRSPFWELSTLSQALHWALNYTRLFKLHGSTMRGVLSSPRFAEKVTELRERVNLLKAQELKSGRTTMEI